MPAPTPSAIPGKTGVSDQTNVRQTTFREETMRRILVGAYFQETNDFHPNNTAFEDFSVRSGDNLINALVVL